MGRPYSEDLRSRIVAVVEAGESRNAAAQQFAVSVSCVVKLMQRFRRTGSVAPGPRGKKPYALAKHAAVVIELVAAQPDLTLDELTQALADRGIRVGRSSVNRFLLARRLTLKKSRFMLANSNGRMSRPRARLGVLASRASTRTGWSSSTRPGRPPT
jgi:putative transposase